MKRINLHDYYPDLPADSFIAVEDEIAAAMKPHSVEDATHARRMRRNKVISLDANDCIENHALRSVVSPEDLLMQKVTWEQLQEALFHLTPAQRQRICAHYFLGMKKVEIARKEGISNARVCESIRKGLSNLKRYYEERGWTI